MRYYQPVLDHFSCSPSPHDARPSLTLSLISSISVNHKNEWPFPSPSFFSQTFLRFKLSSFLSLFIFDLSLCKIQHSVFYNVFSPSLFSLSQNLTKFISLCLSLSLTHTFTHTHFSGTQSEKECVFKQLLLLCKMNRIICMYVYNARQRRNNLLTFAICKPFFR